MYLPRTGGVVDETVNNDTRSMRRVESQVFVVRERTEICEWVGQRRRVFREGTGRS